MNIETLRDFCNTLPFVTEDIKWENDLCFCIGGKMFCVVPLIGAFMVSLKVKDEEFEVLSNSNDITPAAYVARYKWITITSTTRFSPKEWEYYAKQSYELVKAKLPNKILNNL